MLEDQDNEFILGIFLMEAWETVAAVEEGVRRLTAGEAPSPELVTPLVVVSHRLKGAAGLHGYPAVSAVALVMEEVLEALPATTAGGRSRSTQALGDMVGVVKRMLDSIGADGRENAEIVSELHARHPEHFAGPPTLSPSPGTERAGDPGSDQGVVRRMLGDLGRFFAEHADSVPYFAPEAAEHLDTMTRSLLVLEQSPTADSMEVGAAAAGEATSLPEEVATLFRAVHTLKGAAYTVGCAPVGDLAHRIEDMLEAVRERRLALTPPVIEGIFASVDVLRLFLGSARVSSPDVPGAVARTLQVLDALRPMPAPVVIGEPALGVELETHAAASEPSLPRFVLPPPDAGVRRAIDPAGARPSIRVHLDRLDPLMNLVGGLVLARSRLDPRAGQVERVHELVPIGRLFSRFTRPAREAAREAGKQVTLALEGESVEVDNAVMELIADPLLHLVRNAIDHGIESPEERRGAGKPGQATVTLRAYPQGSFVYVQIADDGRGMDPASLREHASRQGFLRPEQAAALSDREALTLVFLPGFSTAGAVTTTSGRGVGMDVVRTNVSRLSGEIDLHSEQGVGTRITIKLPLTVVISDALLVRAGGETFAIPMPAIRSIAQPRPQEIRATDDREWVMIEGEEIELLRLDRVLALPGGATPARLPVLVFRSGVRPLAVAVDELVGKEEVVIKNVGGVLESVGPFGGATISGDGRVILLVDPSRLTDQAWAGRAGEARAARAQAAARARRGPQGRRVLLVDDSVSIRKFVGQMP